MFAEEEEEAETYATTQGGIRLQGPSHFYHVLGVSRNADERSLIQAHATLFGKLPYVAAYFGEIPNSGRDAMGGLMGVFSPLPTRSCDRQGAFRCMHARVCGFANSSGGGGIENGALHDPQLRLVCQSVPRPDAL